MKKLAFLLPLLMIILFSCSDDDDNDLTRDLEEKLMTNLNVLHDAVVKYSDALQQSGDSLAALDSMRIWLANHPDVSGGWFHNRELLEIQFSNGLKSPISIIPVSNDGEHLSRGGGSANHLAAFRSGVAATKKIKNKKVLMMIPYPNEFKYSSADLQNLEASFTAADPDMEVDMQIGSEVDLRDLDRLGEYGLIVLDVHGRKNGFSLIYLNEESLPSASWSAEDVIANAIDVYGIPADKIANGEIEIGVQIYAGSTKFRIDVNITEDYIRKLDIDLSDAVLFGNHCYSGHTAEGTTKNNMPQAWRSKGLATYYGYASQDGHSAPILNSFCKQMEMELISSLITDEDTTGEAHLDATEMEFSYLPSAGYNRMVTFELDASPDSVIAWSLYFRQYFDKDYEYLSCKNEDDPFTTATIPELPSGESFIADTIFGQRQNSSTLVFNAIANGTPQFYAQTLFFSTTNYTGVGTYSVVGPGSTNEGWVTYLNTDPDTKWNSFDGSSGHVTITDDCDTYVAGTFSFPLKINNGSTEIQVTDGSFLMFY